MYPKIFAHIHDVHRISLRKRYMVDSTEQSFDNNVLYMTFFDKDDNPLAEITAINSLPSCKNIDIKLELVDFEGSSDE